MQRIYVWTALGLFLLGGVVAIAADSRLAVGIAIASLVLLLVAIVAGGGAAAGAGTEGSPGPMNTQSAAVTAFARAIDLRTAQLGAVENLGTKGVDDVKILALDREVNVTLSRPARIGRDARRRLAGWSLAGAILGPFLWILAADPDPHPGYVIQAVTVFILASLWMAMGYGAADIRITTAGPAEPSDTGD